MMKLSHLEQHLSRLQGFQRPKIVYEQYATDAHLAAQTVHTAGEQFDDLEGKLIGDLGCGGGIFTIASHYLGCQGTLSLEIDPDALDLCRRNIERAEMETQCIELVHTDVLGWSPSYSSIDVVFMNPPFGTKNNAGIDMLFLQKAIELAGDAVYSFHKTSTRPYILKKATQWGVEPVVLAEMKFHLPASYAFHKKDLVSVEVDLYRFAKS